MISHSEASFVMMARANQADMKHESRGLLLLRMARISISTDCPMDFAVSAHQ
jgi:hypothetical protein